LVPRATSQYVIFIAGADDVKRLIVATLSFIATLDKVLCPNLGIALRAVTGRGVAPAGWGRPQDRINPLVRDCDLFIGIFSRRFGHPTGVAASGTGEEYDLASELRRATGKSPEILLFFRKFPAARVRTGSEDLALLQRFKKRIMNDLLWVDFESDEDFKRECLEQLIAYVLTKGRIIGSEPAGDAMEHPHPDQPNHLAGSR
jgi:hypothetical protein